MSMVHLVGYNDAFPLNIQLIKDKKCFESGTIYIIEIAVDPKFEERNNVKLTDLTNFFKELEEYTETEFMKSLLEEKLKRTGFNQTVCKNISQLLDYSPQRIIPIISVTPMNPKEYGSERDQDLLKKVSKALQNLEGNITYFGGAKHIPYLHHELKVKATPYDFRKIQNLPKIFT